MTRNALHYCDNGTVHLRLTSIIAILTAFLVSVVPALEMFIHFYVPYYSQMLVYFNNTNNLQTG